MSNNAPTKSFYLFYVDLNQVARTVAEMCRKALANSFTRKNYEAMQNRRLLDKQEKIESITVNLKASGELEEYKICCRQPKERLQNEYTIEWISLEKHRLKL